MGKENQELTSDEVRPDVDSLEAIQIEQLDNIGDVSTTAPKFYHATSSTNVAKANQCLTRDEVRADVD